MKLIAKRRRRRGGAQQEGAHLCGDRPTRGQSIIDELRDDRLKDLRIHAKELIELFDGHRAAERL